MYNTIYELPDPPKPELSGLLNLLGVEASDILEHLNTLIKNKRKMLSLNKSRKIIILMILKMPLIFSIVEKIVISIKQLNFYPRAMKIENLLHFYCLIRDRIQWQITVCQFTLKVETFSIKISMLMKISVFYLLNRMIRQPQYQNEFLTVIVLKSTRRVFYHGFQWTMLKNLIYTLIKMQNICSIDLMIILKRLVGKKQTIKHTSKVKIFNWS